MVGLTRIQVGSWLARFVLAIAALQSGAAFADLPPVGHERFLWAVYTTDEGTFVRQTSRGGATAVFREPTYAGRQKLLEPGVSTGRPSLATHRGSQWLVWRENDAIRARALWWGPGRTRTVYDGSAGPPTAPAIWSDGGRLVVVWGREDTLYLSHSEWGVEWSAPLGKRFAGAEVNDPAIAPLRDDIYVGMVFGPSLFTVRIRDDLTWGPNYRALRSAGALRKQVSLASDGEQLWLGYATEEASFVVHSPTGYGDWSPPIQIEAIPTPAAPALRWYDDRLYAFYWTPIRILFKRSRDRAGLDWATPRFELEADASGSAPGVALAGSAYSMDPPTPEVVALNDSGIPAANALNLVFFSEGYLDLELDGYRELVGRVSSVFRAVNPFSKHLDKFNMYRIDLASREKGVDASPLMAASVRQGVKRGDTYQAAVPDFLPRYTDTALGSQYWSCWEGDHDNADPEETQSSPNNPRTPRCDAAEDLENPHTAMTRQKAIHIFGFHAYDRVEQLVPGFDRNRDLLYVIVNHITEDGGTEKASYNPVVSVPSFAEGLGNVHEMGHFMTKLDDEDFSPCCHLPLERCHECPNKTANSDLSDPGHQWAHFFVAEGRAGDSIRADPKSRPPDWPGDFWDPATVNASGIFNTGLWATNGITNWVRTGGTIIYGPAAQCLMNHTGGTTHFCPVCTEEMVKELLARSGQGFDDDAYHGDYDRVYVEYKHRGSTQPEGPKDGFLAMNGTAVPVSSFTCYDVGKVGSIQEVCSVDVTALTVDGTNQLVFRKLSGANPIELLSIQVVNSNGAPLPLFPVTDVSAIASPYYFEDFTWSFGRGDLELEFAAQLQ